MKKIIYSIIFTILLILGAVVIIHGSKLILQTYQNESLLIEEWKTGNSPEDDYAKWVIKRGTDEGAFHILFLCTGISMSLLSILTLIMILKKK